VIGHQTRKRRVKTLYNTVSQPHRIIFHADNMSTVVYGI
jgi:hypothetical protein